MDELLKGLKEVCEEFEKMCKEETGYEMKELVKLEGEEFENAISKITSKMGKMKNKTDKEKFEKAKARTEELKDGIMFKSYQAKDKITGDVGLVVEAQGDFSELVLQTAMGLGKFLNGNKFRIKNMDEFLNTFMNIVESEIEEE